VEIAWIHIDGAENFKTLIMVEEYVNKPSDSVEVRFTWLEQQVTDINRNVSLLMAALNRNMGFICVGIMIVITPKPICVSKRMHRQS